MANPPGPIESSAKYTINTITGLWILDTGSPLLYKTFLPHMSNKVLCQMTVFIYSFYAFLIKIYEQLILKYFLCLLVFNVK